METRYVCDTCYHRDICKFEERLKKYQDEIQKDLNHFFFTDDRKLVDQEWIKPVMLFCSYRVG